MWRMAGVLILLAAESPLAGDEGAADSTSGMERRSEVTVRMGAGFPDLYGAAVAVRGLRPAPRLVLEAGGGMWEFEGPSYFARAGWAWPLIDRRHETSRAGWSLDLIGLAGLRVYEGNDLLITASPALEAVRWFGPNVGLNLQVLTGVMLYPPVLGLWADLRLSTGLTF